MARAPVDWSSALFLSGYHFALAVSLPWLVASQGWSWGWFSLSFVLVYLTGLSITGGYHRLFSHRAYQAHPAVEIVFLVFGTLACQGSAITWSYDHRRHHAHVDEDLDPYSASKGFLFSHFLWMMRKRHAVEPNLVQDLFRRPWLRFQHAYYPVLFALGNLTLSLLLGWTTGQYAEAFVYGFLLRLFLLHHFTWFINSLAHKWGTQNYSREHSAVDNFILSLLTFGEGYHNYHHTFSQDYRNGIKWYHFDPTKWLIWALERAGLAYGLRRAPESVVWRTLIQQHREVMLANLSRWQSQQKEQLVQRLDQAASQLQERLAALTATLEAYRQAKRAQHQILRGQLKAELARLRAEARLGWRIWNTTLRELKRVTAAAH
jgi:stearoyl-CoA desaturase (delta-9 desaturase)